MSSSLHEYNDKGILVLYKPKQTKKNILTKSTCTMSESRFYQNPFDDNHSKYELQDDSLEANRYNFFLGHIVSLFEHWRINFKFDQNDVTVYTGGTGAALLYLKLWESNFSDHLNISDCELLQKADSIAEQSLKFLNKRRYSFLCGQAGVFSVKALICASLRNQDVTKYLNQLVKLAPKVCSDRELPDELLYGRAGYLYALLLVRSKIEDSNEIVNDSLIRSVVAAILQSGQSTSKQKNSNIPLVYFWHNKSYIGAAHGYAGIVYILLEAQKYLSNEEMNCLIKPTVDFICDLQFSQSGNFPSSLNNSNDSLVHWCHGSPGVIHMLVSAYKQFEDSKYLQAAIKSSDDIWQRGLLQKGFGLCHGVSGNGYAFLRLYQTTNDPKYLHRALKFAQWCCEFDKDKCRTPDRPFSLLEGLAGTIYYLIDILSPLNAKFPAFQLN